MMKTAKQRTDEEAKFLREAFGSIKFFVEVHQEIPENLLLKLYKEMKHQFYPKRSKVFQIGDRGTKFYIILKGAVYVLLEKTGFKKNVEDISDKEDNDDEEECTIEDFIGNKDKPKNANRVTDDMKLSALLYLKIQLREFESNYSRKMYSDKENAKISKYLKKLRGLDLTSENSYFDGDKIRFSENFLKILHEKDYLSLIYPNLTVGKELITGDTFGELALRRSIPRYDFSVFF